MAQYRIFKCDFPGCGYEETESEPGRGVDDWSGLAGIKLNGVDGPNFCPPCTKRIMFFIDPDIVEG